MFWIFLTVASANTSWSAVDRVDAMTWWSQNDVPGYLTASTQPKSLIVRYRMTITPNGSPRNCKVDDSSSDTRLDAYTCDLALRRSKYKAARWLDGSPAYAVDHLSVTWEVGGSTGNYRPRGDIELRVDHLPKGLKSPAIINIVFPADEAGRPLACAASPRYTPGMHDPHPELLKIACAQLMESYTTTPALDEGGKPVRSIQNASVAFESDD